MSYYMEVSSCPTLPLSWVPNCPVPNCPVSKCPVPSCPVSSCPGFTGNTSTNLATKIFRDRSYNREYAGVLHQI